MTAGVERVLRAVAGAHARTGAPVMVHTAPRHRTGLDVDRVLTEVGVPASSVLLAHSGDSSDTDHLSDLAERGYLLGMDRFGIDSAIARSTSGLRSWSSWPGAAMRSGWCSHRTPRATSTGSIRT